MQPTDLNISKLSVAERIQLAEDLWDSVAAETGDLTLTDAQQAELDRRLADLERDPGPASPGTSCAPVSRSGWLRPDERAPRRPPGRRGRHRRSRTLV